MLNVMMGTQIQRLFMWNEIADYLCFEVKMAAMKCKSLHPQTTRILKRDLQINTNVKKSPFITSILHQGFVLI